MTRRRTWLRGLAILLFCFPAAPLGATIRYSVSLAQPEKHVFHVEMEIPAVQNEVVVRMPAWNTLYQIRDFSHHVMQVRAADSSGKSLAVVKLDKQTWRIEGQGTVLIRYDTFWDESGPFASQLNREHAFFNPAMLLFYIQDRREEDVALTVSNTPPGWRIATALATGGESKAAGAWRFTASNYDALVDAPVEVSRFDDFTLPGIQPPIRVVVHGDGWDRGELTQILSRICSYEIGLMGGAPFQQYLFLLHIGGATGGAGGGMEHMNSTAIFIPSGETVAGVSAHEFFHLWNVKRIRPRSLDPVDYAREQWTRSLWFAEGVTNTYEDYALVRTGLWSKQDFFSDLGERITELEKRPANRWKSVEEASLDAWLEKHSLYNGPDFSVSYYTKGEVLGFLLDIRIRDATENRASLDDVLRALFSDFAQKNRSYGDSEDIRLVTERVAGCSFEDFFRRYVAGAEPLPFQDLLARAGLELQTTERNHSALGFRMGAGSRKMPVVAAVDPGGPAEGAGLREGDQVLAWNGGAPPRRLDRWLLKRQPGEALRLRIRREVEEMELTFPLGEQTEILRKVVELPSPSPRQKAILEGLLRGTTSAAARPSGAK
ncbi:MAG: PDZ domain-containing protein [Candidatus Acidiferrales bacterium]|jgi:predicted metalloprotease with PDZ domain